MSLLQRLKERIASFMLGRHGPDNLGMFTLIAGLVCSILGSLTGIGLLSLIGFALYVCFVLYFLLRMGKKLRASGLKSCLTLENFFLLLTLGLIIGLAHFSGATLRRPNVSVWMSLVLALIYYATEVRKNEA